MTMATELFNQFQTYWQAGTDARLNLECHAGKVWMTLQINLHHPPPPPPLHRQHQHQSRQSPSRLKRRAKRAEARRAAAKAAASEVTKDVAVQTDDADNPSACPVNSPSVPLPTSVDEQHHHPAAGEVAGQGNAEHVPDVFCPDKDYQDHHATTQAVPPLPHQELLPQLDGHAEEAHEPDVYEQHGEDEWINPHPVTGLWICRCCYYAHSFGTEDDLRKHHDMLAIEYNEYNICYPWHVWT